MPNTLYATVEQAIRYLNKAPKTQPSVDDIATEVNLSTAQLQRLLDQWAGLTAEQFLQFLSIQYSKQLLKDSRLVDMSRQTGIAWQSRLAHRSVILDVVNPDQLQNNTHGIQIEYGKRDSPFGAVFIAATKRRSGRGICELSFIGNRSLHDSVLSLQNTWPNAAIQENQVAIQSLSGKLFNIHNHSNQKHHLLVQGSHFQIKVWQSLLRIPAGMVCSYQRVAESIAMPSAARAVANAIASNPVCYLIPCHRVIRNTGNTGGYRCGSERKQAMLAWEAAQVQNAHA